MKFFSFVLIFISFFIISFLLFGFEIGSLVNLVFILLLSFLKNKNNKQC